MHWFTITETFFLEITNVREHENDHFDSITTPGRVVDGWTIRSKNIQRRNLWRKYLIAIVEELPNFNLVVHKKKIDNNEPSYVFIFKHYLEKKDKNMVKDMQLWYDNFPQIMKRSQLKEINSSMKKTHSFECMKEITEMKCSFSIMSDQFNV